MEKQNLSQTHFSLVAAFMKKKVFDAKIRLIGGRAMKACRFGYLVWACVD